MVKLGTNCPFCNTRMTHPAMAIGDGSGYFYPCPTCGSYRLSEEAAEDLNFYQDTFPENTGYVPHAIRRMRSEGDGGPMIFTETLEQIFGAPPRPSPSEQADNLIRWLGDTQDDPGTDVDIIFVGVGAIVGSPTSNALLFIVQSLEKDGFIETSLVSGWKAYTKLTFKGWNRHEELKKGAASGDTAFLAMEFGHSDLTAIVEDCFRIAVSQTGFELRVLSDPKNQRAGLIDDRLRVEIKAARFIISDLTHDNNGAYWEAGYAEGLEKPVIYTCEKTVFDERKGGTHFDTNHHLHILWTSDTQDEVAKNLKACIRATIPEAKQTD